MIPHDPQFTVRRIQTVQVCLQFLKQGCSPQILFPSRDFAQGLPIPAMHLQEMIRLLRILVTLLLAALLAYSTGPVSETEELVIQEPEEELVVTQYDPPSVP